MSNSDPDSQRIEKAIRSGIKNIDDDLLKLIEDRISNDNLSGIPKYYHRGGNVTSELPNLKEEIEYRSYLKSMYEYDANASARVAATVSEDASWCDKMTEKAINEGLKRRKEKAQKIKQWMEDNPEWRTYSVEGGAVYPGIYAKRSVPTKEEEEKHAKDFAASQNLKDAKYVHSQIVPEDEIDPKFKEAYSFCVNCTNTKKGLREQYSNGKENRDKILEEIEKNKTIQQDAVKKLNESIYEQSRGGIQQARLFVATANIDRDTQKLPENIVKKWAETVVACNEINENTKKTKLQIAGEIGEGVLEVGSYLPVVGTPASLALAAIYAARGDISGAMLESVSALPYGFMLKGAKAAAKTSIGLGKALGKKALNQEVRNFTHLTEAQLDEALKRIPQLGDAEKKAFKDAVAKEKALTQNLDKELNEAAGVKSKPEPNQASVKEDPSSPSLHASNPCSCAR